MAKEKSVKTQPAPASEVTFLCKFCNEAKPLSELTLQTRYFPVLTACRACDRVLQSLKIEDVPEESPETEAEEAAEESGDEKT